MSNISISSVDVDKSSVSSSIVILLSLRMFDAAILYTEELERYEALDSLSFRDFEPTYNAHALSVIILCCSALEARINEFYEFSCKQQGEAKYYIDTLKNQKYLIGSRYSVTEKYNSILELIKKNPFPSKEPQDSCEQANSDQYELDIRNYKLFKEIVDLVALRNTIVHYRPEMHSHTHAPTSMSHFNKFKTKFVTKRGCVVSPSVPYFPENILCFGSAKWSITSTFLFWEEYFRRTEIKQEIDCCSRIKTRIEKWL